MTAANYESEHPPGALAGVRVLDVAAPMGALVGRMLGDLGADVIKIEPPEGDAGRYLSPFATAGEERLSLPFVRANLNKRSVILDLQQREDQERFRGLAAQADVVVSTDGTATWAARGIDLERLSTLYPRLVWLAFSPFGLSGPYSSYIGNNIVAEAMGGLSYIQGDDTRPPCVSPCEQGLYLASLHAACGTLMALWERRTSGQGQLVEAAVHEVLANLYFLLVNYGLWSDIPYRIGAQQLHAAERLLPLPGRPRVYRHLDARPVGQAGHRSGRSPADRGGPTGSRLPQRAPRTGGSDSPGVHRAL